ncbi:teichoic acid transporter [Nostoc sp. CCCryo 231-06]|nr:teichoic acid transporter [Nostoc sp. CCCryo 231-06]
MRIFKKFINSVAKLEDKGSQRIQRAGISGFVTLLNTVVTLGAGLISIPLTAKYLGQESFGVWLILSTFLGWVGIADLGLANSLTNGLSTAHTKNDHIEAQKLVSTAFFTIFSISILILVLLIFIYFNISWIEALNLKSLEARLEAKGAILISLLIFVCRLPLSIVSRIYAAYQEVYFYQLWKLISTFLAFGGLIIAINYHASLSILVLVFFGCNLLLGDIFASIALFGWERRWLLPKLDYFKLKSSRWLLLTGFQLWLAQLSSIIIFQTDLIIIALKFGALEVASYGVSLKLFSLISTIQLTFLSPFWPAYNEAIVGKEVKWIIKIFKNSLILSLCWSLFSGTIIYFLCPIIVRSWVGQNAIPSQKLIIAMLFTSVIISVAHCIGILAAGLSEFSIAASIGIVQGIANIFLSIVLGNMFGVSGVSWSTGICLLIFSVGIMGRRIVITLIESNRSSKLTGGKF